MLIMLGDGKYKLGQLDALLILRDTKRNLYHTAWGFEKSHGIRGLKKLTDDHLVLLSISNISQPGFETFTEAKESLNEMIEGHFVDVDPDSIWDREDQVIEWDGEAVLFIRDFVFWKE